MASTPSPDVLICGAGAAGLTLAIDLARRGVRARVIEKLASPFQGSRGKGIQPRTLEVFEDLGVLDRLVAIGGPYPPQRIHAADGSFVESPLMETSPATPAEPFQQPLMLPQFLTEGVLRDRLVELGGQVDFACELVGLEQDEAGVTASLRGSQGDEMLRVRYLVGADGGRSFVRKSLGIDFPGKTLGVRAIVADVVLTGLDRDAWHRFQDGDMAQQVMICPLAGTDLFQVQAPIPHGVDVDLSAEGLSALLLARTGRPQIQVHAVHWASAYEMNARLADRYRAGRVLLVGDAAHIHPPTGGQGLNTSVQDAYNLGWKLAAVAGGADRALLDTFEAERRPVAAQMLGLATRLLDEAKAGQMMRRRRDVQQLDIAYPASPLAVERPARAAGVRAGDRAPDAPMIGAAGQPRRLFDLLQGPHWTLLGYETQRADVEPRAGLRIHRIGAKGELRDDAGHFRAAYAPQEGDWVLVRPDGYIGAIVGAEDVGELQDYFPRVGLGRSH
ncbi:MULTISPECIES: FAD-dependent oxidoreductase [unclassified Achromobacter]|uniref:FAD-dependent oxidoreductase n=1 Tax=unclassified Achromobacter TaxID=2626865 RepID=UPI000B51AE38|nr:MULTISPECIES: FAD-dependent oxidoreductase [unclassified Achromobacter]OWT72882.1 2-polyprenyl-6-methoxyphenol hydroxylase [Achromobacter sp. HZ34]OWT74100.1 2-polyprenyl-6-methoxyphenol hydroxylase [Achromobacter sp. HZ28]